MKQAPGTALEIPSHRGKFVKKVLLLRSEHVFFINIFSPLLGKHVFLKKLWGIFPYDPPSSAATALVFYEIPPGRFRISAPGALIRTVVQATDYVYGRRKLHF